MPDNKKYYIRFSTDTDFLKLSDYYNIHAHKNVVKRDTNVIKQLVSRGSAILVESESGEIVASSVTYPLVKTDADGREYVPYLEIGTTRMTLNGFPGLLDTILALQVMRAFVVEPPEQCILAHMITAPVQGMALRQGWMSCTVDNDVRTLKRRLLYGENAAQLPANIDDGQAVDWYRFTVEALPVLAGLLCQTLDNPELVNKKTGEKITLDFSRTKFIEMFEDEIRRVAKADLGDRAAPDLKNGMAVRRQNFLRRVVR